MKQSPKPHILYFFFNDTATTDIYTLYLHDALPISSPSASTSSTATRGCSPSATPPTGGSAPMAPVSRSRSSRSEEHTSELQSRENLVCRLLLEKKKKKKVPDSYYRSFYVWCT